MTQQAAKQRQSAAYFTIVHGAIIIALLVLIWTKGSWLDEYWSLWMTDARVPFQEALWKRWLPDVGHPPLFYALAWSLGEWPLNIERAFNLLFAASLVGPGYLATRDRSFRWVFALSLFASPFVFGKFGDHRSYIISIAGIAGMVMVLRELLERQSWQLVTWAVALSLFTLNLEYMNGAVGGILLTVYAVSIYLRGQREIAFLLFATAVLACLMLMVQLRIAYPTGNNEIPYLVPFLTGSVKVLLVAASGGLLGIVAWGGPGDRWRLWTATIAAAFCTAAVLILLLLTKAIVTRHALVLCPLFAAIVAETVHKRQAVFAAACLLSASATLAWYQSHERGWEQFADVFRREIAACPATRIVPINGMLLAPGQKSSVGARHAIELAYAGAAKRMGVRLNGPPSECPTILWVEQSYGHPQPSLSELSNLAHLNGTGRIIRGNEASTVAIITNGPTKPL